MLVRFQSSALNSAEIMTPRKDGEACWSGAMVAHLTCNQAVKGSSPFSSSIDFKRKESDKVSKRKQEHKPQFSKFISNFCDLVASSKADYTWNKEEVNRLDKLTQDYLHALELNGLDYKERARVATQLAATRKLRRASKDTVEVLEPLMVFLDSDKGKNMMNLMRETLGKTRKVEEKMSNRTYRNRVLDEGKI